MRLVVSHTLEVTELRTACEDKMLRLGELVDKVLDDAASDGNDVADKPKP